MATLLIVVKALTDYEVSIVICDSIFSQSYKELMKIALYVRTALISALMSTKPWFDHCTHCFFFLAFFGGFMSS